ncbi:MAG TPA: hypothetical protein VMZ51_07680 [Acidimicrobiales bacterium]|nr:hypothetical protein [Acidimicrobiales bacterium]
MSRPFEGPPLRARLAWLRRRWWVPVTTTLIVATFAVQLTDAPTSSFYRAEALLVVRPSNTNAVTAGTYAELIPQDSAVLGAVAKSLKTTPERVGARISALSPLGTSLLTVRYVDDDPVVAVRGARAVAEAISAATPASPTILPGAIVVARLPKAAGRVTTGRSGILPVGLLLGLCLGAVIVAAWERSNPRIDDAGSLGAETGCPVTPLEGLSVLSAAALLDRWRSLCGSLPARIALIPVRPNLEAMVGDLARALASAAKLEGGDVVVADGSTQRFGKSRFALMPDGPSDRNGSRRLTLVPGGVPGGAAAGESLALESQLTILIVMEETTAANVRSAMTLLGQFGVTPAWTMLVRRRRGRLVTHRELREHAAVEAIVNPMVKASAARDPA